MYNPMLSMSKSTTKQQIKEAKLMEKIIKQNEKIIQQEKQFFSTAADSLFTINKN